MFLHRLSNETKIDNSRENNQNLSGVAPAVVEAAPAVAAPVVAAEAPVAAPLAAPVHTAAPVHAAAPAMVPQVTVFLIWAKSR